MRKGKGKREDQEQVYKGEIRARVVGGGRGGWSYR